MQASESKLKIISIFTLIIILVLVHNYYLFFSSSLSDDKNSISGNAIDEGGNEITTESNEWDVKKVAFVVGEWAVVLGILMYLLIKSKMHSHPVIHDEYLVTNIKKSNKVSETELDILYKVLVEKKELPITELAKYFKVTDKIMIEWCTILEEAKMIIVKYPLIGSPVAKYMEKEKNVPA